MRYDTCVVAVLITAGVALAETLDEQVERLLHEGNYAEAEVIAKRAVTESKRKNGPDHASMATSLNNLAALYCDQGEYDEAATKPSCSTSGRWRSTRKPSARITQVRSPCVNAVICRPNEVARPVSGE